MTWDEENCLMGINDNGRIHQFTYDAAGERVIKSSGDSQNVAINGETAATIVHTDDYTGYVSPYFVINKGKFTKHYFEGAGRIVSKLGNGSFAQPLKITAGGINYGKLTAEQQKALDNYVKTLGVPPGPPTQQGIYATPEFTGDPYPTETLKPVEENQEPPEGWPRNPVFNAQGDVPGPPVQFGPPVEPTTVQAGEGFTGIGLPENDIFYFHPDHLGSTSYITTRNGSISQHVEYIAFGEVLFEEHSSSFSSPYLFNGKELDRETNLSYYGARYLDMKTSLWLSTDLFKEKYPSVGSYIYCLNNPINAKDPDGNDYIYVNGDGSINKVVVNNSPYITVVLPNGKGVLLSDLDISGSTFKWNNTNRQIVANVAGYYGKQAGVTGIGANYDVDDKSLAYTDPDNKVWVHPSSKGGVDATLNNKYDLISTLIHEDLHKKEGNRKNYTYSKHAKVYLKQFQHSSFKKTSKAFSEGQIANFIQYLDYAAGHKETSWENILKEFNDSNILGGYQIKYRESGGTQLFNNKGEELIIPIRLEGLDGPH